MLLLAGTASAEVVQPIALSGVSRAVSINDAGQILANSALHGKVLHPPHPGGATFFLELPPPCCGIIIDGSIGSEIAEDGRVLGDIGIGFVSIEPLFSQMWNSSGVFVSHAAGFLENLGFAGDGGFGTIELLGIRFAMAIELITPTWLQGSLPLPDGTFPFMPTFPAGDTMTSGGNAAGDIVGARSDFGGVNRHAVIWSVAAQMWRADLGDPPGAVETEAIDINDGGVVVGWADDTGGVRSGVLWAPGGPGYTPTFLPPLNLGDDCEPVAVNEIGQIAGNCHSGGGVETGVIWQFNAGNPIVLHTLAPIGSSRVLGLNSVGAAVGESLGSGGVLWELPVAAAPALSPIGRWGLVGAVAVISMFGMQRRGRVNA
jgi:hypothetical protein